MLAVNSIMNAVEVVALMSGELSIEQSIELREAAWWEIVGPTHAALLQLGQRKLCFPNLATFKECASFATGRPITTADLLMNPDKLKAEILGASSNV